MKTVLVILGTRPEAVKMCPIIKEIKNRKSINAVCVLSGQHKELVGDVLSITKGEILTLFITLICVVVIWAFMYNKLLVISVNRELAASRGIKTSLYENIFVIVVAIVVMLSIKWVGILLINSLLILPSASARNIAKNSRQYLVSSVVISLLVPVTPRLETM